jgi:arylsulfatase
LLAKIAGRPELVKGNRQRLFGGMGRLTESSVVSIKNKSHAVTAEIVAPDDGVLQGVIIAQGGSIGGWSLYVKDARLRYCYNLLGIRRFHVDSDRELPPGTHQVRMEFEYDGPGLGKGGTARLFLDGEQIGEGTVGATAAMVFSADDTCDVGREDGALVADDYPVPNAFTGEIAWVEIDVDDAAVDADHVLESDELLRVAMARQ